MGATKTTAMAKYLPRTMSTPVMGKRESSWSVFCFFSSAMTRMVRMGTSATNPMQKVPRAYSKLATARLMLYIMAPMPMNSSRKAPNT